MFESAELGHRIDKERYDREEPALRHALLAAQYELVRHGKFPVVILIGGVDGAGKGEVLNLLNEWMDPRHIQTNAMRPVAEELYGRPHMWRFWRVLPPRGRLAIFVGSWYSQPLLQRVYKESKRADLELQIEEILGFEQMLADEGTLLLKFWLHLSEDGQRKRFRELAKKKRTAWRVTDQDWKHLGMYPRFEKVSRKLLRETSTASAPWIVVDGSDEHYRSLAIGTAILDAMTKRLANGAPVPRPIAAPPSVPPIDGVSVLDRLDLTRAVPKEEYEDELAEQQGRLNRLTRHPKFEKYSVVAVFEGCDAAGKGGAIRRVTAALDARKYDVIPIAAPTDEEKARPYLWRFWRHIPENGRIAVFDRSWYGRVLVERVEGFCSEADWMRAYGEINDFEEQLVTSRTLVVKFWLQISKDEQLRRFEDRQAVAFKQHKITDEDWRNRNKLDAYSGAVCDMIDRTSTELAPWTLVEANDKYFARLKVLRTLADTIERALR
ncbi:MAG: polyphosphate:AMP phosphotransferase [Deltaproteobacteria bacterium]|nr:polyphosphate:AMP phosphotransferase [Deltaproteobacteria bacterium]